MVLKSMIATCVLAAAVLPMAAVAQSDTVASQPAKTFYQQVERDSFNEIQEALMAEQRAQDPSVRGLARLIIDDHTILASMLSASEGSAAASGQASNQHQATTAEQKFEGLSGAKFDQAYIDHEVQEHQQSIGDWQKEAKDGSGEAATLAKFGLPMQREHLELFEAVQTQLEHSRS